MSITYQSEPKLSAEEFQSVLETSGLAARRPSDPARLEAMLRGAQVIITARDGTRLVGVARSITDWAYCLYCSDLCVDSAYQGRGIGKALLERTALAAPDVRTCLLLSAPAAVSFYDAAGFKRHDGAFVFAQRT
ncbi:GNAT family N-acetyltransferase [Roseinatronobacter alkalisoli]|uniref:GNAT family N-acetyltransferase n=1 Tax=Roseinatronobacter alkalisoli TaxID=3028235 RepID=A0ABT5T8G2_9RHOB|nr:GNAT family N-acetyltransferase [Roseinatronobacter sp. HJB301]MDD7971271.1 GNAT family N-acetyltransferase [Roseinatronobacter sp. HJB301]